MSAYSFSNSPGQKLESMVVDEKTRKLEISGHDPRERAYQYKVLQESLHATVSLLCEKYNSS